MSHSVFIKSLVKRIGIFYIGTFLVMYTLGTADYYTAKSIGHPIFSILYEKYLDGGTQEWTGIGYIITSPNELIPTEEQRLIHGLEDQPRNKGISVQHGWELRPWPIFKLPIIGRTLFMKRDVSNYIDMTYFTDYKSAIYVYKQNETWPGIEDDFYFIISSFAFGLLWFVFEAIRRLARKIGVLHRNNN